MLRSSQAETEGLFNEKWLNIIANDSKKMRENPQNCREILQNAKQKTFSLSLAHA